ncbi:hypothetical protein ASD58_15740 [Duganella sp. Root1480D1]|nr:hypothetical protein ASD58_15740 [Duganella sp. Root1480D1]
MGLGKIHPREARINSGLARSAEETRHPVVENGIAYRATLAPNADAVADPGIGCSCKHVAGGQRIKATVFPPAQQACQGATSAVADRIAYPCTVHFAWRYPNCMDGKRRPVGQADAVRKGRTVGETKL